MMKLNEITTEQFRIMAMQRVADHAYNEYKAASATYTEEKHREHSLMLDWAHEQLKAAEGYFNGVYMMAQAAGYQIVLDGHGGVTVEPISA